MYIYTKEYGGNSGSLRNDDRKVASSMSFSCIVAIATLIGYATSLKCFAVSLQRRRPIKISLVADMLLDAGRGQAGRVRLHRDVLRSETQAHDERDAVPRRVQVTAKHEYLGRLEISGRFSSSQKKSRARPSSQTNRSYCFHHNRYQFFSPITDNNKTSFNPYVMIKRGSNKNMVIRIERLNLLFRHSAKIVHKRLKRI